MKRKERGDEDEGKGGHEEEVKRVEEKGQRDGGTERNTKEIKKRG